MSASRQRRRVRRLMRDDCLSVVSEVEGLAVAEATGPKTSERPAGAEAPGSDELMESPAPLGRTKGEAGMGLAG